MGRTLCHHSNRLEALYDGLRDLLFTKGSSPFSRRLVVVPNLSMKRYLMTLLANDPQVGIAAGIEFMFLEEALQALYELLLGYPSPPFPTSLELALRLEWEIKQVLNAYPTLTDEQQARFAQLYVYFDKGLAFTTKKGQLRLSALSKQLSQLFLKYGLYAGKALDQSEHVHWQDDLWQRLFHGEQPFSYPYAVFGAPLKPCSQKEGIQVHLFAFSHIAPLYIRFFVQASQYLPLHFHLLSPTRAFWTDIRSEGERAWLQRQLREKGVALQQREALEELMSDTNPLLANLGKLGREMAFQFEVQDIWGKERYRVSKILMQYPVYEELIDDEVHLEERESPSLLHCLQADLLLLRNPEESSKIVLEEEIPSIQIHEAPTRRREVEILYQNLLHLMQEKSILPGDILVMAPRIADYIPCIKAVFEKPDSQLAIQISDVQLSSQNRMARGLMLLLQLPLSRWSATSLLEIFQHPLFCKKHKYSKEDIAQLKAWIEETHIQWGESRLHRQEVMEREYCGLVHAEEEVECTWEFGLKRLLWGLMLLLNPEEARQCSLRSIPASGIDFPRAELLGKWMEHLHGLREKLASFSSNEEKSLDEWIEACLNLALQYFDPLPSDIKGMEEKELLWQRLSVLKKCAKHPMPFSSLRPHLMDILAKESETYHENHLQAVRFSSLLPMRAIPAQVICLLGLDDGAFPRREPVVTWDLCRRREGVDPFPAPMDFDRYLFLESFLSARDYFLISYQGRDLKDHKEKPPSTLVSQLQTYLDRYYLLGEASFSERGFWRHPSLPFDRRYFTESKWFPGSKEHFQEAKVYYQTEKVIQVPFLAELASSSSVSLPSEQPLKKDLCINVRHLLQTARKPLKTYFESSLGMYLKEEREIKDEEEWTLSHLEAHLLRKEALACETQAVLNQAEKEGRLPPGLFKEVAMSRLLTECRQIKEPLGGKAPFSLRFSLYAKCAQLDKSGWLLPAIRMPCRGKIVSIVGHLDHLSAQGLLSLSSKPFQEEAYCYWPALLILDLLSQQEECFTPPHLLIPRSGKTNSITFRNSKALLEQFVAYHLYCLENPSPLLPEWIDLIMKGEPGLLEVQIEKDLKSDQFYDRYAKYAFRAGFPSAKRILILWQEWALKLYREGS